jgi:hypothetical protein
MVGMQVATSRALALLAAAGVLTLSTAVPARAQAVLADDDQWHFAIVPYMWFAGLEGTLSVGRFVEVPVDVPFSDVISNFDIGLLAHFEGRKNRFGWAVDVMYLKLGAPVAPSAPVLGPLGVTADVRLLLTEGLGFYRVAKGGRSDNQSHLDLLAGVRYIRTSSGLENDVFQTGKLTTDWVDGLIGVRFRAGLGSRAAFIGRGDVAGLGSEFTWNLEGDLAFLLSKHWALGAGWRHLDIDYDKGEGRDRRVFDVAFDGPRAWFSYAW